MAVPAAAAAAAAASEAKAAKAKAAPAPAQGIFQAWLGQVDGALEKGLGATTRCRIRRC
ncbi:MAG: hypothetical protein GY772_09455 [bacterium]|nr:hypothetical protein [bacterium]